MRIKTEKNKEIILSIGMIVKNEEKVLERCLKSLQPLMKEIPSELIIADTGSTDSSIEIAKKYTDNVFNFEWINDFAAARNSTLKKAKGIWYFFLDADEYLDEDIHELIEFFRIPDLYLKYKTLQINVRNYYDEGKKLYSDVQLSRFHRLYNYEDNMKVTFNGTIHETIYDRQPLGYFQTILHHTGYCFETEAQNRIKKERNLILMREEYKNNSDNLRLLSLLIDGSIYNSEEVESYINKALSLLEIKENRMSLYGNVLFMQAISYYIESNPIFALTLCDLYYKSNELAENQVCSVAIEFMKSELLCTLGKYDEAFEEIQKYFMLYNAYKEERINLNDLSAHVIIGLSEYDFFRATCASALCLRRLKKYKEALKQLEKIDIDTLDYIDFKTYTGCVREICMESHNYIYLAKYYEKVNTGENAEKKYFVLYMMESVYYSLYLVQERLDFANEIVNSGVKGSYIELMNIVMLQNSEGNDFQERLYKLLTSIDKWEVGYSEALYLAIKYKLDISTFITSATINDQLELLNIIAKSNDDFAKCITEYDKYENYCLDINKFYFIVLLNQVASLRPLNLNKNDKSILFTRYCSLLSDYVFNIYNPELLNDDDVAVLPEVHRFGYYMKKANEYLNKNDSVMYIRYMKKALINCETAKEIIEFLLDQFKKTL